MHDVVPVAGVSLQRSIAKGIVTAHLPFTTESRFIRKVENIRKAFALHERYFGQDKAWHWRRWLELADRGELHGEFERTRFSDETLFSLREQGIMLPAAEVLNRNSAGQ